MIMALYVKDFLLAGNYTTANNWMEAELSNWFEMKDLGYAKHV